MNRIDATFAKLAAAGRTALIPYVAAGDPSREAMQPILQRLVAAGADVIELGVPFSDPMADGPVIQRAAARAIRAGTSLARLLEMVAERRTGFPVPIVLFGYYNPFFRYGVDAVARDAKAAGIDGFLCVDLPPEEAADLAAALGRNQLDLIRLLAPTTPLARARTIAKAASGFLYFVSVLGVTGARAELPAELPGLVERVRSVTALPVGVGFGVQTPEQARWLAGFADAVIVGSAIQRLVEGHGAGAASRVEAFVRFLKDAMRSPARRSSG